MDDEAGSGIVDAPALRDDLSEERAIAEYFRRGYTNAQICAALEHCHGFTLTLDQVKKRLVRLGLRRRGPEAEAPLAEVEAAIRREQQSSGEHIGYRTMHTRLRMKYGLRVPRDTVMMLCAVSDPEGTVRRHGKKLLRRIYRNQGPDYMWHLDGYDKLKPFGFAVHACIDGFSRRILWIHVATTNNNPAVIAGYFVACIKALGGCPRVVRADRGSENVNIAALQRMFRHDCGDEFAGEKAFMYGRSTANQRIEAWWGHLKKNGAKWWTDFFKDMTSEGLYDGSNPLHTDCIRYCFMSIIQKEFEQIGKEWNVHRIRPSQYAESPGGIPDVLYFTPEAEGAERYSFPVCEEDLLAADDYIQQKPPASPQQFVDLADYVIRQEGRQQPTSAPEAKELYTKLVQELDT